MVVQHNLRAMNSNRMLGVTSSQQSKSTEKLSSGFKINRAADDAAGLAISEKMRKQIRGLTKAVSNAQDGISCVQTAEGALAEVHDMLQRMNELAMQAANGTNSDTDRGYLNSEVEALTAEIDRISSTVTFNDQKLLNGSFTGKALQVGFGDDDQISITIDAITAAITIIKVFFKTGEKEDAFFDKISLLSMFDIFASLTSFSKDCVVLFAIMLEFCSVIYI